MKPPKRRAFWNILGDDERAIICAAMRAYGDAPGAHPGMIPLFKMATMLNAMRHFHIVSGRPRVTGPIIVKMQGYALGEGKPKWRQMLYLQSTKVYRRFGQHPELGITTPWAPEVKTAAGMKYNSRTEQYVPNKIQVKEQITLRRVGSDQWVVSGNGDQSRALAWLTDICGH